MSGTNTPGVSPAPRVSVVEKGETIRAGQLRTAISAAAIGLISAGVYDGKMGVSPEAAVEAAAAVYQIVHSNMRMRFLMSQVAKKHGVDDAYGYLVAQENPSR